MEISPLPPSSAAKGEGGAISPLPPPPPPRGREGQLAEYIPLPVGDLDFF